MYSDSAPPYLRPGDHDTSHIISEVPCARMDRSTGRCGGLVYLTMTLLPNGKYADILTCTTCDGPPDVIEPEWRLPQ